ncbi:serine hydrolase [Adhaeribacter aerolatus]|uniref:Serine hydrolase n=1 Tax=Adhaeribacter aerolatus TaxID=670289 RepID=A0A512B138_9BACT|nr:serine hydrolase domain-containing protein [Adhaeribacter aerolatus]GEO05671.1 serine hydrolase [Adhaeribacter aerolatus]
MRHLLLSFIFSCCFLFTFAQKAKTPVLQESKPEAVGMSTERLQRLDRVLQEYTEKNYVPGAIALIARNGKIVYHKAVGLDDTDNKKPLKRDAIMRIASQTKAITSIGLMMLYEEGKFLLDDPLSKYIPAFRNPKVLDKFNPKDSSYTTVPARGQVTIRQLLTHTSGIGYPAIGTKEATAIYAKAHVTSGISTPNAKLADAMNTLGTLPLMHQPGEQFTYGLSTDVLGYLIEILSGQPLDVYFQKRIFEPLGMKDTYFYLPAEKHNRLAILYAEDAAKNTIKARPRFGAGPDYPKVNGTYFSGGAGLSSTAYDYAIFLQMLLNGGEYNGKRLLGPATVKLITTNQIGDVNQGDNKFGLGFGIITAKGSAKFGIPAGSFEWGGYFGTTYWVDPANGIVALLYTQKTPNSYGNLSDKFRAQVYQAITDLTLP